MMSQVMFRAMLLFAAVLAGSLLLTGVVALLCVAIYLALIDVVSPAAALAMTSILPLILGAAAIICVSAILRGRRSASRKGTDSEEILHELGNLAGSQLFGLVEAHPRKAAIISLAAGFVVGVSPDLRGVLRQFLNVK